MANKKIYSDPVKSNISLDRVERDAINKKAKASKTETFNSLVRKACRDAGYFK